MMQNFSKKHSIVETISLQSVCVIQYKICNYHSRNNKLNKKMFLFGGYIGNTYGEYIKLKIILC